MKLPLEFRWLLAHDFKGFTPWHLIDENLLNAYRAEFQKETGQDFYPFARRQDCDDFAGFRLENGEITSEVVVVHLTWSGRLEAPYNPITHIRKDAFEWLREDVLPETAMWVSEEDLEDILKEAD